MNTADNAGKESTTILSGLYPGGINIGNPLTSISKSPFAFKIEASTALAQEKGKIYHLSYSPDEPVALEDLTISVGVENPGNKTQNYLLEMKIAQDGKIVHEQEFTFTLENAKGIFFTPKFAPKDIGEFEVIVQLYDKFKINLFDTKITKFNSVSHLGPFDIVIEPQTSRIRPGFNLPAKLFLENMGSKGTDVTVLVSVACEDKNLIQSLTIFLPANGRTERLVGVQTCEEEGLYEILASILVFNKTWISSVSQFFINSSFIQLQFEAPEKIVLKPGESYTSPVEVTNLGNQKITDLKFFVERIPLAWQTISPSSVIEVEPNERMIFIVNITIPPDAEPRSYEIRTTAAAEEVLERQISTLEIASLAILPSVPPPERFSILTYAIISFVSLASALVVVGLLRRYFKRKPHYIEPVRVDVLTKIKEKIKSKK